MLFISSDHAGIELKANLINFLAIKEIEVEDLGCNSGDSVDYPDYANRLTEKVLEDGNNMGILICGTGIGMSMAANRKKGIRAALCFNSVMANFSRIHNNANVLCLGARIIGEEVAKNIVDIFINSGFEWGRHKRRIDKLDTDACSVDLSDLDELDIDIDFGN